MQLFIKLNTFLKPILNFLIENEALFYASIPMNNTNNTISYYTVLSTITIAYS